MRFQFESEIRITWIDVGRRVPIHQPDWCAWIVEGNCVLAFVLTRLLHFALTVALGKLALRLHNDEDPWIDWYRFRMCKSSGVVGHLVGASYCGNWALRNTSTNATDSCDLIGLWRPKHEISDFPYVTYLLYYVPYVTNVIRNVSQKLWADKCQ